MKRDHQDRWGTLSDIVLNGVEVVGGAFLLLGVCYLIVRSVLAFGLGLSL